jgi:hypothetical protein
MNWRPIIIRASSSTIDPVHLGDLDQQVGYMVRRAQLAVFADFSAAQSGAVATERF